MTFQYIIHHLDKPHSWFIVLTNPHTELNTKKETGAARFYYLCPIGFSSAMLGRVYKRNTHPGDSEMCICICN